MFMSLGGIKMCECSGHTPVKHNQKVINLDRKEIYFFPLFFFDTIPEQMNS